MTTRTSAIPGLLLALAWTTALAFPGCEEKKPAPAAATPARTRPPASPDSGAGGTAASTPATPAPAAPAAEGREITVAGLTWTAPEGWERLAAADPMRAAQLTVPGMGGEPGEVVFFFFGVGQGGTVEDNIRRWASQVVGAGGQPAPPQVGRLTVAGLPVTRVEMEGTYMSGRPGGPRTPREGYAFRGAIAEGPQGTVYIRFVGPAAVVEKHTEAWQSMLTGMKAP